MRRAPGLWWQLAYHVTLGTIFLPLEEGSLEINMPEAPPLVRCQLAGKAEARAGRGGRIRLLVPFLPVLEASQRPSRLALLENAILVALDGQDPSACDVVAGFDLAEFTRSKTS